MLMAAPAPRPITGQFRPEQSRVVRELLRSPLILPVMVVRRLLPQSNLADLIRVVRARRPAVRRSVFRVLSAVSLTNTATSGSTMRRLVWTTTQFSCRTNQHLRATSLFTARVKARDWLEAIAP